MVIISNRVSGRFEASGVSSAGDDFCCMYQGPLCTVVAAGGDGPDFMDLTSGSYDLVWVSGASLCPALSVTADGGGGSDNIEGSNATSNYTETLSQGNAGGGKIDGNAGNDTIQGGSAVDNLYGGAGDDVIYGNGSADWICGDELCYGTDSSTGEDEIWGGPGDDVILGWGGNDTLRGGVGGDILCGGAGVDFMTAHDGADKLWGGGGTDHAEGGSGTDECDAESALECEDSLLEPSQCND